MSQLPAAVQHVKITNRNTFEITDAYDGVPYVFKPKHSTTVPLAVAGHIFGFDGKNTEQQAFAYMQRRFGWHSKENGEFGREFFNRIEIRPVILQLVEQEVTLPSPKPEPEAASPDYIPQRQGRKAIAAGE